MLLIEKIEDINKWLDRDFGRLNELPKWRVVWSEDQFEKRYVTHTPEGLEYLNPQVEEVRKYGYIKERYILEQLTPVDPMNTDIADTKLSYEPLWTFSDEWGNYLPPSYLACKFVIEAVYENVHSAGSFKKYKDPDESKEAREKMITDMEETLFGNETPTGDALAHGYGVAGFHKKETIQ